MSRILNGYQDITEFQRVDPGMHVIATAAREAYATEPIGAEMKPVVAKRSIIIDKHKTSVSLEDQFWTGLKTIASERHLTVSELVSDIDRDRQQGNLSSALRLFVLGWYRSAARIALHGAEAQNPSVNRMSGVTPG